MLIPSETKQHVFTDKNFSDTLSLALTPFLKMIESLLFLQLDADLIHIQNEGYRYTLGHHSVLGTSKFSVSRMNY